MSEKVFTFACWILLFFTDREFSTSERERATTPTENVLDELFFISLIKTRLNKSRVCSHQFFFFSRVREFRSTISPRSTLNCCRRAADVPGLMIRQLNLRPPRWLWQTSSEKKKRAKRNLQQWLRMILSLFFGVPPQLTFFALFRLSRYLANRKIVKRARELFLTSFFYNSAKSALFSSPLRHLVAPAGTKRWKVFNAATNVCHHRTWLEVFTVLRRTLINKLSPEKIKKMLCSLTSECSNSSSWVDLCSVMAAQRCFQNSSEHQVV